MVGAKSRTYHIRILLGPFIFYEVEGGLVGFEGGACKKIYMASKGGQPKKYGV